MTILLLDASTILAAEDPDDANYAYARALLRGQDPLATLDLARYEVTNVATRAWRDPGAAHRLLRRIDAIGADSGIVPGTVELLTTAVAISAEHGISVYDAAYVAAAESISARLVSCDLRDLVSRNLAVLPADAVR